jgi:HSP20 family protein
MTELFDKLLHLPEVFDRTAAAAGEQAHQGAHGHAHVHGLGGAPVDIVETPGEYTFVLDVPGLSKSDIQVRRRAQADSLRPVLSE